MNNISDIFYNKISEKLPVDFNAIMKELDKEVVKTELFSSTSLPNNLSAFNTIRGSVNAGKTLTNTIFEITKSADPYYNLSEPIPVGANAWIMFTLEEIVEPTLLEYESAKDQARTDLIAESAAQKLKDAAKDAHAKILASMVAGKDFQAAAEENEYTPTQVGPYSSQGIPPKNEINHRQLYVTASGLNSGELSEVVDEPNRSLFIHVNKREIEDTEQNKTIVDGAVENSGAQLNIITWLNWINTQFQQAEVKLPAER